MIRCGGFAAVAAAPSAADVAATSSPATSFMGALATIDGLVAYPRAVRAAVIFSPSSSRSPAMRAIYHTVFLAARKSWTLELLAFDEYCPF